MGNVHSLPLPSNRQVPSAKTSDPCVNCTARSLTICAPLTLQEQCEVASLSTGMTLKPRQVVFHEGDEATHVFNITSGSVALSKSMADGRRQITGFLGAGDFLGFGAGSEYSLSAETLTEVHACRFTKRNFQQLLERIPTLEHRLLSLAENELETAQDQILLLGRKTAMERIASFLLQQMERAENRGMTTTPLLLPMTRAEVGDYLGLTIETVSRCFTKLRKANIISLLSADRVCINLPEKLAELASPSS
ncbi:Crp/Fnr family transcriptional regulator [Ferrovibrio sp.]|jgi:CRP/FNR family transcriptional regulator|uniref:Crp/Fnr family transcriptional regulator n=1 Tax=Ferrovibrio sp. TaxID=1917215 RepID=UPI0035B3ECD3